MMRGPPAVAVIFPKLGLPNVTFGAPRVTWLNTLNVSIRSSTCLVGPTETLRVNARSTFQNPGTVRKPVGVLPHKPGVFGANAAVLNHWLAVGSASEGSPTMSGR